MNQHTESGPVPMGGDILAAIVIPIGPGREAALDTLDSIAHYCREPHCVVLIDDCTADGTYEALVTSKKENWFVLRNSRPMGRERLVHTLAKGYQFVLEHFACHLILRLDQDALVIKPGVITDAFTYSQVHKDVGLFGVYEQDYNRPRSYEAHRKLMDREMSWYMRSLGRRPWWSELLKRAEDHGYTRGDNVFGGAYFITRACLQGMDRSGALNVPFLWNSRLMEDVYFSMVAVAAGYRLGHFAAPDGPLCMEWRGLPYPAAQLAQRHFKLVHSVDRGQNTSRDANNRMTAREVFASIRQNERVADVARRCGI